MTVFKDDDDGVGLHVDILGTNCNVFKVSLVSFNIFVVAFIVHVYA